MAGGLRDRLARSRADQLRDEWFAESAKTDAMVADLDRHVAKIREAAREDARDAAFDGVEAKLAEIRDLGNQDLPPPDLSYREPEFPQSKPVEDVSFQTPAKRRTPWADAGTAVLYFGTAATLAAAYVVYDPKARAVFDKVMSLIPQ